MTKMNPSRKIKWQNFSLAEDMVADSDETASKVSNMIILSHKGTCIFTNLVRNFWDILEISTCHGRAAAKASMDFRLIAMPDKLNFSKSDSDKAGLDMNPLDVIQNPSNLNIFDLVLDEADLEFRSNANSTLKIYITQKSNLDTASLDMDPRDSRLKANQSLRSFLQKLH